MIDSEIEKVRLTDRSIIVADKTVKSIILLVLELCWITAFSIRSLREL